MTVNQKLKLIRKDLKISQVEFGEKLGIDKSSMSKIESGKLNIGIEGLNKLQHVFDVDLNWLIAGKGKMYLKEGNYSKVYANEPQVSYLTEEEKLAKELSQLKDEMIKEKEKRIGILENRLKDVERKLDELLRSK